LLDVVRFWELADAFVEVAEAMRYLSSGLASHIHVALGRDIHVAHGPEERYRIPSAMCEIMGQWFLMDVLGFA
jgi:hypothetical protein